MLKYRDLTPEQKAKICNGCGGKGGFIKPPQFLFRASCNQHDFYYWRGGTELDRKKADDAFYRFMKMDANSAEWYRVVFYRMIAFSYYRAVRAFGKKYFSYGKMKEHINF